MRAERDVLANGAEIIDIQVESKLVLAHMPGEHEPYVTWEIYRKQEGVEWTCFRGLYFSTLDEARANYLQRVGAQYETRAARYERV